MSAAAPPLVVLLPPPPLPTLALQDCAPAAHIIALLMQVPQSRRLYENVVPDTVVPGVVPPPNSVLSCFTPSGDYLIAFQPISNELVAYRFKGLHISGKSQPQGLAGSGNTNNAAGVGTAAAPLLETSSQPALGSQPASQQQAAFGQQEAAAAAGEEQEQRQVAFSDVFRQHWRCCPCPGRQEQLSTDFCLTVHDRFLLVATATPERQPPAGARGAARLVPWVDRTTFHLVRRHVCERSVLSA